MVFDKYSFFLAKKSSYLNKCFRNYDAELYAFGNRLGESFSETLLRAALTHKSYIIQESRKLSAVGLDSSLNFQDNEDLSLEGSELLSKFINGYLRAVFSRVPEELIT